MNRAHALFAAVRYYLNINNIRKRSVDVLRAISWRLSRYSACLAATVYGKILYDVVFIGITGSAGKTTTKDLVVGILSLDKKCVGTSLSYNEPTGVAKTIMKTKRDHDFSVIEVSGGRPGDMDWPLRMFRPKIAVLTMIEREHVKSSLGLATVRDEKKRLIQALPKDGVAVLNIDDPMVRAVGEECQRRVIWVGREEGATVRLVSATSSWPAPLRLTVEYDTVSYEVETRLYGTHLALPVICALGVALAAGVCIEKAIIGLKNVKSTVGRMQVVESTGGVVFIRDDWKAPYWSFQAPLDFMRDAVARRKVIVIGTLSDYSVSASKAYKKVAQRALSVSDLVLFVGPHALRSLKGAEAGDSSRIRAFPEIKDAARYLADELTEGDLVLLKGSNKADHLGRLVLDRDKAVTCWVSDCGRGRFCAWCDRLYAPTSVRVVEPAECEGKSDSSDLAFLPSGVSLVVVGLGNPGERFQNTRHNVGHGFVDWVVQRASGSWTECSGGKYAEVPLAGGVVVFFKPFVAMNESGPPVRRICETLNLALRQCVVVHDDLDLPLRIVRLKSDGGDAGHRGVRSVIKAFGTGEVWRVRVGVRSEGDSRTARALVHQHFSIQECAIISEVYEKVIGLIEARILSVVKESS